jgi:hypothetical protein
MAVYNSKDHEMYRHVVAFRDLEKEDDFGPTGTRHDHIARMRSVCCCSC